MSRNLPVDFDEAFLQKKISCPIIEHIYEIGNHTLLITYRFQHLNHVYGTVECGFEQMNIVKTCFLLHCLKLIKNTNFAAP